MNCREIGYDTSFALRQLLQCADLLFNCKTWLSLPYTLPPGTLVGIRRAALRRRAENETRPFRA